MGQNLNGKLHVLPSRSAMPDDTANVLRRLADRIERGEVSALIVGMVADGCYEWMFPSSRVDSLTLSALLHATCIDRMRG
jgi:hypothetical protein